MSLRIERADGSTYTVSGYEHADTPSEVRQYDVGSASVRNLPPKVDMRPSLTAVENQGASNSCVANAVAGAYEYLFKRHHEDEDYDVSRLFVYYNARRPRGRQNIDGGTRIIEAIESLRQHGACSEATWPFVLEKVNTEPDEDAYGEASGFLIEDVLHVPTDMQTWKQVLAEGYPIIFAIQLFKSFDAHRKKGLVPSPSPAETGREAHGAHALLCVGYSDPDRVFIVRNSWGSEWGDGGYCYMPYDYVINADFNHGDSWIIRQVDAAEIDEETWGDDSSLIEDVGTVLAQMTDEEYSQLLDAMGEVPLEARLAHLMLSAVGADGDIADDELEAIAEFLGRVFDSIGVKLKPNKVLRRAGRLLADEALLEETVALFDQHLPKASLAGILAEIAAAAGADDISDEESHFVYSLVQAWQVEAAFQDAGDDQDDEEDEEEGEEDEGDAASYVGAELAQMSEEDFEALEEEAGDVSMDTRIALVLLGLAMADGDLSEEEFGAVVDVLDRMFDQAGIKTKPRKAAQRALGLIEDDEDDALFYESVELIGRYLSPDALGGLFAAALEIVGADGLNEQEEEWLAWLAQAWEIEVEG